MNPPPGPALEADSQAFGAALALEPGQRLNLAHQLMSSLLDDDGFREQATAGSSWPSSTPSIALVNQASLVRTKALSLRPATCPIELPHQAAGLKLPAVGSGSGWGRLRPDL